MSARGYCLMAIALAACGSDRMIGEPQPDATAGDDPPTYYRDVAPILGKNCTGCHRDGGLGPFELTSYAAAADSAAQIADVTARRIMPPWPAESSGACNTFVGARLLSDADIATLGAWVAADAPAGDSRDAITVTPPPDPPFAPAIELRGPAPYTVVNGPDIYRCFVIDPALVTTEYITALRVKLDNPGIVHHMQLFAAETDAARTSVAARDADDPQPGYACLSEVGDDLRYVGVWALGDLVRRWPDDTGVPLSPGAHLVLQFHYHNHGTAPVADHSAVELELAHSVLSPGTILGARPPALDLAPGQPEIVVSAPGPLPHRTSYVRAVRVHMHQLGKHARLELVRGQQNICLLDIPRWDFNWQLFYTLEQPIRIEVGDHVRVTCAYDTTDQAQTVTWGESTEDEMCIGYSYVAD